MAHWRIDDGCVREVLVRWQARESIRSIARNTGLDRETVRRYVRVAEAARVVASTVLDEETVAGIVRAVRCGPGAVSELQHALSGQHLAIRGWLFRGVSLARIHRALARAGVRTSYATLRRFAIRELGWCSRRVVASQKAA